MLGIEAYMAGESRFERPVRRGRVDDGGGEGERGEKLYYHLTLLAESTPGYKNLIKLSSAAFLEGYFYKPRLDWELLERHKEGVIATTGCLGGVVCQALLRGDVEGAVRNASRLRTSSAPSTSTSSSRTTASPTSAWPTATCIDIAKRLHGPRHPPQRLPRAHARARGGLQDGGRAAGPVRVRRRRPQGGRGGQGPGRPAPPGRHPRRRGGHHPGAAHRVPARPAQAGAGRRPQRRPHRHPVRDARRGRPGPAQDGLPGPAQPHRHRAGPRPHRGHHRPPARHRQRRPRGRAHLRDAAPGRLHRGVPAGGRAHAGPHPVTGPHHASTTWPPWSPSTGRGRWRPTCTTTSPTARTAASRSPASTPTWPRSWPTPTG